MIEGLSQGLVAGVGTPYGAWAPFWTAVAESSVFPIPPDVLLSALGVANPGGAVCFGAVCTSGSVLGGAIGCVGRRHPRPYLYSLQGVHQGGVFKIRFEVFLLASSAGRSCGS